MPKNRLRDWVRSTEHAPPEEQWALLCFLAGPERRRSTRPSSTRRSVARSSCSRPAAIRDARSSCTAAPSRRSPTISTIRRCGRELAAGLEALQPEIDGLRGATEALRLLGRDGDLAWQCYAMSLLAEHLADEE